MSFVVDGSNVLGHLSGARESVEAKRALVRSLGDLARGRRTRVYCFFDGMAPDGFARSLGAVTVTFSGSRPADDAILDLVRSRAGDSWVVVTSDAGLASRAAGRKVRILRAEQLRTLMLETVSSTEIATGVDEWSEFFSDPKNRHEF